MKRSVYHRHWELNYSLFQLLSTLYVLCYLFLALNVRDIDEKWMFAVCTLICLSLSLILKLHMNAECLARNKIKKLSHTPWYYKYIRFWSHSEINLMSSILVLRCVWPIFQPNFDRTRIVSPYQSQLWWRSKNDKCKNNWNSVS